MDLLVGFEEMAAVVWVMLRVRVREKSGRCGVECVCEDVNGTSEAEKYFFRSLEKQRGETSRRSSLAYVGGYLTSNRGRLWEARLPPSTLPNLPACARAHLLSCLPISSFSIDQS